MSVDDVGLQPPELGDESGNHNDIARSQLPAHLFYDDRSNTRLLCEIAHIAFAFGNDTGDQRGFVLIGIELAGQPHDMFRGAADVQPVDDSPST